MKEKKEEKIENMNYKKIDNKKEKRISFLSVTLVLISIFAVVVFLLFVSSSSTNFNEAKNGNEPSNYRKVKEYTKNDREVKYYYYTIYKIEVIKYNGEITYTLKPILAKDY